jgi:hypothetical protein
MSSAQIRQRLHDYIDIAEDKKLKAIYTLLRDDIDDGYKLTEEQKAELDRRSFEYQNCIGRNYSWEETVAMAKKAVKDRKNNK